VNLYPHFKQVALDSGNADNVDMNTDTIKVLLYDGYTYDSADVYVSDLSTGTEVARSGALTSPTVTNGTFDAADITVAAVPTGHTITDIIIYKDTGVDTSSVLIAHIDEDQAAAALSLATNGSDVDISFDAAGIFDL
jgi:hypothetical protein